MPRPADPATHKLWQHRLDRFARGGLSVADFCRREGVSQPSFYQWRRKLTAQSDGHAAESAPPKFVSLMLSAPSPAATELTLRIAGNVRLSLPASLRREQLTDLFAAALAAADEHAASGGRR